MTTNKRRFLALFLTLCLGISLIPGGLFLSPAKAETYGIVINGSIKLRRERLHEIRHLVYAAGGLGL